MNNAYAKATLKAVMRICVWAMLWVNGPQVETKHPFTYSISNLLAVAETTCRVNVNISPFVAHIDVSQTPL